MSSNQCYKVITADRKSAYIKNPDLIVDYPINEWAYPRIKGCKLTCFTNYFYAKSWMEAGKIQTGLELICVPCETKNQVDFNNKAAPLIPSVGWRFNIDSRSILCFWDDYQKLAKRYGTRKNPKLIAKSLIEKYYLNIYGCKTNIAFCDAIKCLE